MSRLWKQLNTLYLTPSQSNARTPNSGGAPPDRSLVEEIDEEKTLVHHHGLDWDSETVEYPKSPIVAQAASAARGAERDADAPPLSPPVAALKAASLKESH